MQQKPSVNEFLEKRKLHRTSKEPNDAIAADNSAEQDAANDPGIADKTGTDSSQPVIKNSVKTVKERAIEIFARKARHAQILANIEQEQAHDDEQAEDDDEASESDLAEANDDESENDSSAVDENDNEAANTTIVTPPVDHETKEIVHRPAVTTGIVPGHQKPYPLHAFGSLAAVIALIAQAVQVNVEMVGSSLLGVISALAQSLINVSSRKSDQGCPVTLNMFVIASSGERKSSTIDMIIKPVYAAISRADDERRSMIIQDVTVDGMVVGLIERCAAQFLLALEGASLLGGHAMSRDNLSRFLGNVASLFSGEPLTRTRVEEHHYAQGRRLSVLLFSQPIVAMDFLSSELVMQQGMGNRFLYSQPPSLLGTRKHADIELDEEPLYQQFCAKITALASHPWKINPETGGMDTRTVRMSPGAKAAWVDFYNKLEMAAGPGGDLATHAGYVTRFAEQVMRMAALLAILEDQTVQHISEDIMLRAIDLGDYYLESAMHLFNVTPANKDEADAKTLLDWMQNKSEELILDAIPVRMMYKDGPRCARPSKRTKELLALLVARGEVTEYTETIVYADHKRSSDNYAVTGT
jgi:hypothetical protein